MSAVIVCLQPGGNWRVRQSSFAGIATRRYRADAVETAPVDQFFGKPGLADARFAADQEKTWPACGGGTPRVEQRVPFVVAADERIDRDARRCRDDGRLGVEVENLAVRHTRRGARLDSELLFQERRALLIDVQRGTALAAARVTAHQRAPGNGQDFTCRFTKRRAGGNVAAPVG